VGTLGERPEPPDRPDLYVLSRILYSLYKGNESHTLSSLQMASRLNYGRFRSYLAFLKEKNLIDIVEEEKGSDSVHLTPEGAQAYHDLVEWIEEVIGHDFSYG